MWYTDYTDWDLSTKELRFTTIEIEIFLNPEMENEMTELLFEKN